MALQITIDQTGKPAGVAGQAREDLDLLTEVVLTATGGYDSYAWLLLDAPPNEEMTTESSATVDPSTGQVSGVTPDNAGTYLVRCTGTLSGVPETTEITFYAGPALASDPTGCPRRVPSFQETTHHNAPDVIDPAGNTDGWAREWQRWFRVIVGIWNWMRTIVAPTPTFEAGADTTVEIEQFELEPRCVHTEGTTLVGYTFDLGLSRLEGHAGSVLIDWTLHAVVTPVGDRFGVGCWKLSSSFEKSQLTSYLKLVGESDVVKIDAGAHTFTPSQLGCATGGGRTHTVILNLQPAVTDFLEWTIFGRATIVRYPNLS